MERTERIIWNSKTSMSSLSMNVNGTTGVIRTETDPYRDGQRCDK